jgi:SAM-dependent methyltransferase
MFLSLGNDRIEENRILEAYRRRANAEVGARYSCFRAGHLLNLQQLERCLLSSLQALGYDPLKGKRILEVGCGSGGWLRRFIIWGSSPEDLFGVDLQESRISDARDTLPRATTLKCGNAAHLEFPDGSFDLVVQFTMFSSVLSIEMKRQIASEMLRVLKPGGYVVWYDFFVRNRFNPDVCGIGKREIQDLFPGCRMTLRRVTLAPPIARKLGQFSAVLCDLVLRSSLLCVYYLAFLQKPRT